MLLVVWRVLIGIAAIGALTSGPGAKAEPSSVGMLACTAVAAPSAGKGLGGWQLSCSFQQEGSTTVQHYAGAISGIDRGSPMAGAKALLVWNVLAATAPRKRIDLVGVYKATQDAALPPQALTGGRDETIILQPVSDSQANVAPFVQQLQLELPRA